MTPRAANLVDAPDLADIHAHCFPAPWSAQEISDLLMGPGGFALTVEGPQPSGFILCRALVGEAEVLTLAVEPRARGQGLAKALLWAALGLAQAAGAEAMFLEVAADNAAALALYEQVGFVQVGLRRGYYANGASPPIDALVYRRALNSASLSAYV